MDELEKYESNAIEVVRMPLPLKRPAGPGVLAATRHPIALAGQAVGVIAYVCLACISSHANFNLLTAGFALISVTVGPTVLMIMLVLLARELRLKMLMLFFSSMFLPVARLVSLVGYRTLRESCMIAIGDIEQGMSRMAVASACYGDAIRQFKPFWRDSSTQREFVVTLAASGRFAEATAYGEQLLAWSKQAVDCLKNEETMVRLVYNTHTLSMVFELCGDRERARQLKLDAFQAVCEMPIDSEARIVGLLCQGEALVMDGKYAQAVPVLQEFVTFATTSFLITCSSTYMGSGYQNLAIALAHTGKNLQGRDAAKAAHRHMCKDLSSLTRLNLALLDGELSACEGELSQALEIFHKAEQFAAGDDRAVIARVLNEKVKSLSLPALPEAPASVEASTELEIRSEKYFESDLKVLHDNRGPLVNGATVCGGVLVGFFWGYYGFSWPLFAFALFLVSFCIVGQFNKRRSAADVLLLVSKARQRPVIARLGIRGLTLRDLSGSRLGTFRINAKLAAQLRNFAKGEPFKATAYVDDMGNLKGIDIFGYLAALTK